MESSRKVFIGLIVIPLLVTVVGGGIVVEYQRRRDQAPTLEVAGDIKVLADRTLIPLRTTSSLPVIVHSYEFCILELTGAPIEETPPLVIDATHLEPGQWYTVDSPNFQVTSAEANYFPVSIRHIDPHGEVLVSLKLVYGNNTVRETLELPSVPVKVSRR